MGTAGLAGAVVVLIGGNLWGVLAAAVTTFATLWLIDYIEQRGLPRFFGNVAAGAMVTAVAVLLVTAGLPVRPSFIVAGGIVALLPAIDILAAVSTRCPGYVVTAGGRFIDVLFLFQRHRGRSRIRAQHRGQGRRQHPAVRSRGLHRRAPGACA